MPKTVTFYPHETRIAALELAVQYANGGADIPRAAAVVDIAKVFEKYLTEEPIKSYEIRLEDDDDDASGGDKPGAKRAP